MPDIHQQTFGTGKPLVLVHGWAMHSGIWRDFALQLARHYQVTCVDLPGHGHSGASGTFTLASVGDALVDAITDERSCWLGWSLGATVVLDIARRYPERVSALVVLAGNPVFTQSGSWPGIKASLLDTFADSLQADSQATLLRFLALQVNGLADHKQLLKTLKTAVFACPPPDPASLQGGLDLLKHADLRAVLTDTPLPLAVILGARDTLVPVSVGHSMQALTPEIKLTVIEKAGHTPFLSHPKAVLAAVAHLMDAHVLR